MLIKKKDREKIKDIIQMVGYLKWALFTLPGIACTCTRFKRLCLSIFDFLQAAYRKKTLKNLWQQVLFFRFFRSAEPIDKGFAKTLRVAITYRCNFSCEYCYARGLIDRMSQDMSRDDFEQIVVWARKNGWRFIRFLGGEPTIHRDFNLFLQICREKDMQISLATNNIECLPPVENFNKKRVHFVSINYTYDNLSAEKKEIFYTNLIELRRRRIKFEFSCILNQTKSSTTNLFLHAQLFKPMAIRVSIAIPGNAGENSKEAFVDDFSAVAKQIFNVQQRCFDLKIPFYIYRPLPPCLFEEHDWQRLRDISRYVCYTRCPLGARDDYSKTVLVNPDLSIFPCIAVFLKGPKILTFSNKKEISDYYKPIVKKMLATPFQSQCKECDRHAAFCNDLERPHVRTARGAYGQELCQGSCLSFNNDPQWVCHSE
jgi:organic radical activating enzyme